MGLRAGSKQRGRPDVKGAATAFNIVQWTREGGGEIVHGSPDAADVASWITGQIEQRRA
jgi:hypothetical protein